MQHAVQAVFAGELRDQNTHVITGNGIGRAGHSEPRSAGFGVHVNAFA